MANHHPSCRLKFRIIPAPLYWVVGTVLGFAVPLSAKPWALESPVDAPVPVVEGNTWSSQPVDAFVLEKLRAAELQPSPQADRRTLIRRATFDLTGLPPTPDEVSAFVNDSASDAYPRLIDRLLASPHYGEQWARHWLDVARYSDTKGYVYGREEKRWVHASAYRDWVVRAFNEDLPYDRFLLLQIAADQLVPERSPDLAAMGFLTVGRRFLGVTHDVIDDRIDVVMRGTQALTVACARCHDHKFDPIPTADYYSLYGVFQSCAEAMVPMGEGENAEVANLVAKNRELLAKRRGEQMDRTRARLADYLTAQMELEKYPEEVFNQLIDDGDLNPFIVRRWEIYLERQRVSGNPVFTPWHALAKSAPSGYAEVLAKLRSAPTSEVHPSVLAAFASDPADMKEVAKRYADVLKEAEFKDVLEGIDSPCHVPDEHIANIEMYFPTNTIVELWKSQGDVDRSLIEKGDGSTAATILVDRPLAATPRIFKRGNPLTKGEEVPRHFLQAIAGPEIKPFSKGSGRLELAQAIASKDNPLTARVMVNRVWMHHFGNGLVTTPSDFGKRADAPSHPKLLDWLALRFMESGWSLKQLHRTLMLSQTYQQSSSGENDGRGQQIDPANRLLWRMNPHRLSFEEARDAWLAATGELDLKLGGRPETLFGGQNFRRTLYAYIDRENLPPELRVFDFANPDLSISQRTETSVPQQALFGMNHPFIASKAIVLTKDSGTMEAGAQVQHLYERLYQRQPTVEERELALAYIASAMAPAAPVVRKSQWTYGYGAWNGETGRLEGFTPLPHFNGSAWQGGDQFPDAGLGWVKLTATGGHPGNDAKHAIVRRWTAPQDGDYQLKSTLIHEPEVGDGIRAFVAHGSRGLLRSTVLHHSKEEIDLPAITMHKGETLDFIVDIRDGLNSDQFLWVPLITVVGSAGTGGDVAGQTWNAEKDFGGDLPTLLNPWQQLAQVLMLSNEFMFVD